MKKKKKEKKNLRKLKGFGNSWEKFFCLVVEEGKKKYHEEKKNL